MKFAYFIPLHHKLYQFRWLFDSIYSADDHFCLHVDKKASRDFNLGVAEIVGQRPNVRFLRRQRVNWGGWSQIAVELEGIQELLRASPDWKYLINLSGQDYPLKPIASIRQSLAEAWPNNFIRVCSFDAIAREEPHDPHLRQQVAVELFGRRMATRLRRELPHNLRYKGAQWHILSRRFCQWLIHDPMPARIARHMKWTHIPDETYFQAAIMNSPFQHQRAPDHGRIIVWPGPKTLTMEHYGLFEDSSAFFGRKFDAQTDREVLVRLADSCGFPIPASQS
jgi:hypothetical protein